jgi:hypothetical protein
MPDGQKVAGTLRRIDDFTVEITDDSGTSRTIDRTDGVKVDIEDRLVAHRALLDKYTDADIHNLTAFLVTLK